MTIHGFRGNIKENNLKNSTLNMLKIQPYIDAIDLKSKLFLRVDFPLLGGYISYKSKASKKEKKRKAFKELAT
jgi:hypothetical protein